MTRVKEIVEKQKRYFLKNETKNINFRIEKLKLLKKIIVDNENEINKALHKDLNKSPFESYETEIGLVLTELDYVIKNLPKWAKRKKVKTPLTNFLSKSYIYSEPLGVVLIMSPWNYPFQLTIDPLIGAIAAGNCAVLKTSSYSKNTSSIIHKLISENFDESFIAVLEGGREINQAVLEEKFDYILFTGSVRVGKIVMEAASKNLTPVTLELGGKSPCIVDDTCDIDLSAKRIIWGKLINAGQTCVAPDYILVDKSVKNKLIEKMEYYIIDFFGKDPLSNPEYPKIINSKHFNRILNLIDSDKVIFGGDYNEDTRKISPTILDKVSINDNIMKEEIFGPLLPIIGYKNIDDIISLINSKPKPLALYLFSNDKTVQKKILDNISFGGGCINDTLIHFATSHMPFGGVGESGMGSYHGKASFDTFSHKKSIVKKSNLIDISLRYPPYKDNLKLLKKILK